MPVGIIAATVAEARILYRGAIAPEAPVRLSGGTMLVPSGIGPIPAQRAAEALVRKGATSLVSWGTAGGLLPGLSSGTLILPSKIVASDQSVYPTDPIWHERLCSRLKGYVDLHIEAIAESATVLATYPEKTSLWQRTGGIATDMESASIAGVAKDRGLPFMAVRAIIDPAEVPIAPSLLNSLDGFGRVSFSKLGMGLIRNPLGLMALIRLIRNFQAAQAVLSIVYLRAGNQFLCPSESAAILPIRRGDRIGPRASERMD